MVLNTKDVFVMTSAELIGGSSPGDRAGETPSFVYLTDLAAWYILDVDDRTTVADNLDVIKDATGQRWRQLSYNRNKVNLFEDFLGDAVPGEWAGAAGTDAEALAPAIVAGLGGLVRLTSGNVGTGVDATDSSVLTQGLNWQADKGGLLMQAKLSMSLITNITVFVGFTDLAGAAEVPLESSNSADLFVNNAADAAGLMFDTDMTTDEWGLVGTKDGTEIVFVASGAAPVADVDDVIRVEIDAAGTLTVHLNGVIIGTPVADAITPDVPLTPCVSVMTRAVASPTVDVDYILGQQNR